MSELDCALWKRITQIVQAESRPFCNLDFVPEFQLEGKKFKIAAGTFRNKVSNLVNDGKLDVVCYSPQAFYTLKGIESQTSMTCYHTGVSVSPPPPLHSQQEEHKE